MAAVEEALGILKPFFLLYINIYIFFSALCVCVDV